MIAQGKACTGCGACEQICPTGAISMKENDEGFCYPVVDESSCIRCGKCLRHCHLNREKIEVSSPQAYAVYHKEKEVCFKSSSGGAFSALAESILRDGGLVAGCAYTNHMKPAHILIDSLEHLERLRGSKYVESDLGQIYSQIEKELKKGRRVLFTGTGCQNAGLLSYLGKDYDGLICVDIICHGVPSRWLFQQNVALLEERAGEKMTDFHFRSKKKVPWGSFRYEAVFSSGKRREGPEESSVYYHHFLKGDSYRESCYQCRYCSFDRPSDLTIADYWGVEKHHPDIPTTQGVSLLMVNSPKGERLFQQIQDTLQVVSSSVEWAAEENHNLRRATPRPEVRDHVYGDIRQSGYSSYCRVYERNPRNWIVQLKGKFPYSWKKCVKRILGR